VGHEREPLPASPGHPRREDYECERHGTANLFLWYEPLQGHRHVEVTDRRIPDVDTLKEEVAAWEGARNALGTGVDWHFTTEDACIKLKHLYPVHKV
jgi:hypothetical protein